MSKIDKRLKDLENQVGVQDKPWTSVYHQSGRYWTPYGAPLSEGQVLALEEKNNVVVVTYVEGMQNNE